MKKYTLFILLLSVLLISCSSEDKSGKVIHPTEEFILKLNNLEQVVSLSSLKVEKASYELQPQGQIISKIGSSENIDSPYFLPTVKDIAVDEFGNIYMSIPEFNEIRVFDKEGVFKQTIGGAGRGPGEFRRLSHIDYDKEKQLLIAADSREVELFNVHPDTVTYSTTVYTKISIITDACILGDSFYVNGFLIKPIDDSTNVTPQSIQSTKPIHKFNLDSGEYQFSFGYKYQSASNYGVFDGILSKTQIECSKETNTVVGILNKFPLISGYNPADGSLKWESGIIDFRYLKLVEKTRSPNVTLGGTAPDDFYHTYTELVNLHNGNLLLQIGTGVPSGFSLKKAFSFLSSGFKIRPVLINSGTGKLTSLPKQHSLIYFKNDRFTVSSPPPKTPIESRQVIVTFN